MFHSNQPDEEREPSGEELRELFEAGVPERSSQARRSALRQSVPIFPDHL